MPKRESFLRSNDGRARAPGAADAEPIGAGEQHGRERLAFFLGAGPELGNLLQPLPYLGSTAAVGLALGCGLLIERFVEEPAASVL